MARTRSITLGFVALFVVACAGGGASGAPTGATPTGTQAAVVTAEPTEDACAAANLDTLTAGQLTVGADEPAYPPFYSIDDPAPSGSIWSLGQPPNGKGLESATAYAVSKQLGFSDDQVTWVIAPFNTAIQPGPKTFDIYLTQVSYSPQRAEAVDLSDGYFDLNQAVVGLASNAIAKVTTVAGLKPFRLGAQVGTTSYQYIVDQIKPDQEPRVYDSNDAAIEALKGGQIQGIVADLPTTFYMRDAQLDGGQIVGSLPTAPGATPEHYSILLDKGSKLTPCVNAALAAIKADGTLAAIVNDSITSQGAPELK
jgi:polar amino acid transport system substrate-binding protein